MKATRLHKASGWSGASLSNEAIRLGRLLCQLMPEEPENLGLLALMLLQDSRTDARVSPEGALVTLEEQDRSKWDRNQIQAGLELVPKALRMRVPGPYQLQAAIAAIHAEAADTGSDGLAADRSDFTKSWRDAIPLPSSG